MAERSVSSRIAIGLSTLGILFAAGCAQFRLPAIDPSGERIFLPADSYTTLVTPSLVPGMPEPAYQNPPAVPSCGTPPPPAPIEPWSGRSA